MSAVCQYALSYNVSGAISAGHPVGYTTAISLVMPLLVVWFYGFMGSTVSRLVRKLDQHWVKASTFYWIDLFLFGGLIGWGCLFIGTFVWSIVEYYKCYTVVPTNYKLNYTIPQEYLWLVMFGLSYSIFAGDKAILLWRISYPKIQTLRQGGDVAEAHDGKAMPDGELDSTWLNYTRIIVFASMVLFLGVYTFVLEYATPFIDYCGGGACWPSTSFYRVGECAMAASILLVFGLFQPWLNSYLYGEPMPKTTGRSAVFSAGEAEDLALPYILGWVPTYPLGQLWIIAYGVFIVSSTSQILHDYVKGVELFFFWWFIPIVMTLLAQNSDYFFPYHIACVMISIFIFWFNTGIVTRVQGTSLANNAVVKDWGNMMTGPDSNANIVADATWIDLISVLSVASAALVFLNQRGYFRVLPGKVVKD